MRNAQAVLTTLLLLGAYAPPSEAQLSGLNRFEFQAGNTPFTSPADMTTSFNQLDLRYDSGSLRGFVRVESFLTPVSEREYHTLSQYRVAYREGGLHLQAGHFYEILGRGLLLRAFEIPGATYEDAAFRVRQSFHRDIEGFALQYSGERFGLKAIRGRPLLNVLPPTLDRAARRPDLLEAAEGTAVVGPARLGLAYLRNATPEGPRDYAALSVDWTGAKGIGAYVEFAQRVGTDHAFLSPGSDGQYAFYGSVAFGRPGLGGSAEYKRYHDFFLGSGFNDPPSLIREHSYALLNRSTHVLNVLDERGFQLDAWYELPGGGTVTLNTARAVNDFGLEFVFREYFAEYALPQGSATSLRFFADYAEDPFKGEASRVTAGVYADHRMGSGWTGTIDLQAQTFRREFGEELNPVNLAVTASLARSTRYSVGIAVERSTDPFHTDDPRTAEVETAARHWFGVNLGYRPNRRHTLAVFLGTRRGGPACTSGICYEVLDFEGAEVRLTSRF